MPRARFATRNGDTHVLSSLQLAHDAQARSIGMAQAVNGVTSLCYWQAGACVGLVQGYVYAAAEACHALGLRGLEQQLRWWLPGKQALQHHIIPQQPAVVAASQQQLQDVQKKPLTQEVQHSSISTSISGTPGDLLVTPDIAPAPPHTPDTATAAAAAAARLNLAGPSSDQVSAGVHLPKTAPLAEAPQAALAVPAAATVSMSEGRAPPKPLFEPLIGPFTADTEDDTVLSNDHASQQQQTGGPAEYKRLSSFALECISPATTATTLIITPASSLELDAAGQGGSLKPGRELLALDNASSSSAGGHLAAVGASGAATKPSPQCSPVISSRRSGSFEYSRNSLDIDSRAVQQTQYLNVNRGAFASAAGVCGSEVPGRRHSGEYKVGLPAQRHYSGSLARASSSSSTDSLSSASGSAVSLSAQYNACFAQQASVRDQQQVHGAEGWTVKPSAPHRRHSDSSSSGAKGAGVVRASEHQCAHPAGSPVAVRAGTVGAVAVGGFPQGYLKHSQGAGQDSTPSTEAVPVLDAATAAGAAAAAAAAQQDVSVHRQSQDVVPMSQGPKDVQAVKLVGSQDVLDAPKTEAVAAKAGRANAVADDDLVGQVPAGDQQHVGQIPAGDQEQVGQVPAGDQEQVGQVLAGDQEQVGQVHAGSHEASTRRQQRQKMKGMFNKFINKLQARVRQVEK